MHSVQRFSSPVFIEDGWEVQGKPAPTGERARRETPTPEGVARSQRRAAKEIFEFAICNPDLDCFFTLTFAPSEEYDRTSYDDAYKRVKAWFSNRVQRRGMRYILVAERHKEGGIHFHGLCNVDALRLVHAVNPHTGEAITDRGRPVYNIKDWDGMGFSTAKLIDREKDARVRVSKYITKYITKGCEKIGGRYFLHGGKLRRWDYAYGEEYADFTEEAPRAWWCKEGEGFGYAEYDFM